jgi:hypothetical protein
MNSEPSQLDIYGLLIELKTKVETVLGQYTDHESRLRSLEKFRWQLPTAIIVSVGSALTAAGAIIYDVLSIAHH